MSVFVQRTPRSRRSDVWCLVYLRGEWVYFCCRSCGAQRSGRAGQRLTELMGLSVIKTSFNLIGWAHAFLHPCSAFMKHAYLLWIPSYCYWDIYYLRWSQPVLEINIGQAVCTLGPLEISFWNVPMRLLTGPVLLQTDAVVMVNSGLTHMGPDTHETSLYLIISTPVNCH